MSILVGIDGTSGDVFGDDTALRHVEYDAFWDAQISGFTNRLSTTKNVRLYSRRYGWNAMDFATGSLTK